MLENTTLSPEKDSRPGVWLIIAGILNLLVVGVNTLLGGSFTLFEILLIISGVIYIVLGSLILKNHSFKKLFGIIVIVISLIVIFYKVKFIWSGGILVNMLGTGPYFGLLGGILIFFPRFSIYPKKKLPTKGSLNPIVGFLIGFSVVVVIGFLAVYLILNSIRGPSDNISFTGICTPGDPGSIEVTVKNSGKYSLDLVRESVPDLMIGLIERAAITWSKDIVDPGDTVIGSFQCNSFKPCTAGTTHSIKVFSTTRRNHDMTVEISC
ncbi:MAG: hypothetical protein QF568_02060 [Flavobacteriales bacterium]|jgi:hypothetical protein|nr:hypothetical protein [Flavobacteriales bacterium]